MSVGGETEFCLSSTLGSNNRSRDAKPISRRVDGLYLDRRPPRIRSRAAHGDPCQFAHGVRPGSPKIHRMVGREFSASVAWLLPFRGAFASGLPPLVKRGTSWGRDGHALVRPLLALLAQR